MFFLNEKIEESPFHQISDYFISLGRWFPLMSADSFFHLFESTNPTIDISHFIKLLDGAFVFAVTIIFQHLGQR